MLGTDYPFPLGELEPGSLIESMEDFDHALKVKCTVYTVLQFKLTKLLEMVNNWLLIICVSGKATC